MSGLPGVWREPGFVRLWGAAFCSETAEWMLQVALPVLVYRLTGSVTSTATMMIVGLVPALLVSPVAGVLADRVNRRVLLWCVCIGQAAVAAPLLFADRNTVLMFGYLVMAGQATVAALFEPARNALVPELVGAARVAAANGLLGAGSNIARLVGASLGGLLFATGGLRGTYFAYIAALLLAVLVLLARFRNEYGSDLPATPRASALRDWIDGMNAIREKRVLWSAGMVLALMSVAQGIFLVVFVPFVVDILGGGSGDVGLLRGVQAIGGLAAGVAIATIARDVRPGLLLGWGLFAFGLISAMTWNGPYLTGTFEVYLGLFTLVGAPGVIAVSGLLSVLQTAVHAELAGRVMSTAFAAIALCTVGGMLFAGMVTDRYGLIGVLNGQAVLYAVAGTITLVSKLNSTVAASR